MDSRFLPHNTHLEDPGAFRKLDPNLKLLAKQPLIHYSSLLSQIPHDEAGVFTLTGGRQIGKTTLLKQWMARLLERRVHPERIAFVTGELIDDHHSLVRLITDLIKHMPVTGLNVILLDEVTYIKDWDKGLKYLADSGGLERCVLVITGSDSTIIKEARMRLPGRRGLSDKVDFHLFPLSFHEFVTLNKRITQDEIDLLLASNETPPVELLDLLFNEFGSYLLHGGFLTAINDMAKYERIYLRPFPPTVIGSGVMFLSGTNKSTI